MPDPMLFQIMFLILPSLLTQYARE